MYNGFKLASPTMFKASIITSVRTGTVLLIVVLLASSAAAEQSMFLASIDRQFTVDEVAGAVERIASDSSHSWNGRVEYKFEHIGVIGIKGPSNTCDVLKSIKGVRSCQADRPLSIQE